MMATKEVGRGGGAFSPTVTDPITLHVFSIRADSLHKKPKVIQEGICLMMSEMQSEQHYIFLRVIVGI